MVRAILWAIIGVAGVDALFLVWWVGEARFGASRGAAALSGAVVGVLLVVAGTAWMRRGHARSSHPDRAVTNHTVTTGQESARERARGASAASPAVASTSRGSRTLEQDRTPLSATLGLSAEDYVTVELPTLGAVTMPVDHLPPAQPAGTPAAAVDEIATYQEILGEKERQFGTDHVETIMASGTLANAYWAVGRLEQAIALYERTVTDSERVLGVEHPFTLSALVKLASAYELDSRLHDAITLYEEAFTLAARIFGDEHPETAAIRDNLVVARAVLTDLGPERPDPRPVTTPLGPE